MGREGGGTEGRGCDYGRATEGILWRWNCVEHTRTYTASLLIAPCDSPMISAKILIKKKTKNLPEITQREKLY